MEKVLAHQSLDRELETLAARYSPPDGRAFLARQKDVICGVGAYHRFDDHSCEMKRLFVPPAFHGRGIGRKLAGLLISEATADGYDLMRLDTARHLKEAIGMYEKLGFRRCPPYQIYPPELLPHLVFMERPLGG
jgi:ribosomal protein S18 acetylase RimI-like enzyme